MTPVPFNEALRAARAATRLTQQAMADKTLIPKRTIEDWERGKATPPPYVQRFVLNELADLADLAKKKGDYGEETE